MSDNDLKELFHLIADASYLAQKHRWLMLAESLEDSLTELAKLMGNMPVLETV